MIDPRRRSFLRGRIAESVAPQAPVVQRPPWALPQESFVDHCDRCRACVQACPLEVLKLGDGGFPEVVFSNRGCDFCGACERACKPRALDRAAAEARGAQAGLRAAWPGWQARIAPQCLALQKVECRICAEVCDARAIRPQPAPGGVSQMRLDPAACTACGECVGVCPIGAVAVMRSAD